MLLEKRAAAAETIALKLEAAEAAMLDAVPLPQLEAIVANTKVSAKLRPAFLGYAGGVMLAALGATAGNNTSAEGTSLTIIKSYGITPSPVPQEIEIIPEYGAIKGKVIDTEGSPIAGAVVSTVVLGEEMNAKTSENGTFLIDNVRVGLWTVTAACKGYRTATRKEIKVKTGYSTYLTFKLVKSTTNPKRTTEKPAIDGIRPDRP